MLIKNLDYLTPADMRKLGGYADMTIDQYISEINSKLNGGIRINDFYKKLYYRLKIERPTEIVPKDMEEVSNSEEEEANPILRSLAEIPLDYIQYHVSSSEYNRAYNSLHYCPEKFGHR